MPRSAREVPKEIAAFGERQFNETGAAAVEVLRVKAATMRKHFSKLRGVTYLVSVISLDRVRVYFFTQAGVMVIGENLEPSNYAAIRRSSRLLAKFEKPRELTPEEKRIEATEELRSEFRKALRRVSRFLASKEPDFPNLFVAKALDASQPQSFGSAFTDDGEVVFDEGQLGQSWSDALLSRVAFVVMLPVKQRQSEVPSLIGNSLATTLMKPNRRSEWLKNWQGHSKDTAWTPLVEHLATHVDTYRSPQYQWLRTLLSRTEPNPSLTDFSHALKAIHDECVLPIGTEEYHKIAGYANECSSPRKLQNSRFELPSVHLSPRVLSVPEGLGLSLGKGARADEAEAWAQVSFREGNAAGTLQIGQSGTQRIERIDYILNLEDVYPSTGGHISQGSQIIQRALQFFGVRSNPLITFQAEIAPSDSTLNATERAVLERLLLGKREIVLNSLIGSPHVVDSLVKKKRIVIVPDFHHLGVKPDFLLHGEYEGVLKIALENSLEATVFRLEESAYAVVSSPSTWRRGLLLDSSRTSVSLWPVVEVLSERRILRHEPFPTS